MSGTPDTSHHHHGHGHHAHPQQAQSGAQTKDPVCGMSVDPATAKFSAEHAGETYYFCSSKCHDKFLADPGAYLSKAVAASPAATAEGTIYTCPIHPQVRQDHPGNCPICGMTLEPELPTADTGPSAELGDMTRRFWIGTALAVPVFLLEMGSHLFDFHAFISAQNLNWVQLVLATPVVLWAGWPFFQRGVASIANRSLNMFTLIAMALESPGSIR